MLILAVETSCLPGTVALCRDGACLDERALPRLGRNHAQTLVATVADILQGQNAQPADCDAVAVSIGPGSFTGLRMGAVFTKTFAFAVGCRIAAVDTFQAVAARAPDDVRDVLVVGDAQRGELYVGRYKRGSGGPFTAAGPIEIVLRDTWCRDRAATDVVTGPGLGCCEDLLETRCRLLPPEIREPRAVDVARLGLVALNAGQAADFWTLAPLYVRKSAAEEVWESRHPGAAQETHPHL